jgi:hypothetical protein
LGGYTDVCVKVLRQAGIGATRSGFAVPPPEDVISPERRDVAHLVGSRSPPRPRAAATPSLKVSQNAEPLTHPAVTVPGGVEPPETATDALALAEPPVPVQVMLYVVFEVGATETEPDVPFALKPLPVHEDALVELQVSVADWPLVIEVGFALNVTVGAGVDAACRLSSIDQPSAPLS